MTRLAQLAAGLRSSNAGVSRLTFDLIFEQVETFTRVCNSGVITTELIGKLLGVRPEDVRIYPYQPALAIKITIPRVILAGDPADTDIDGKQQHAPLLDIEIP